MPSKKQRKARSTDVGGDVGGDGTGNAGVCQVSHRKTLRGRRGSLQDLPNMPLDILYEFFCQMEPLDLLHLARTSKAFRALLMSRTSAPFWKAARSNVDGLPGCPPFLSEPAFANLAFDTHCHKCLKPNIRNVIWEFKARYCSACRSAMSVSRWGFLLPGYIAPAYLLPGIRETGRRSYCDFFVHLPDTEVLRKAWLDTEIDTERREEFLRNQKDRTADISHFASKCREWHTAKKTTRSGELTVIRKTRLDSIVQRLRGIGWGDELDIMGEDNYYKLGEHSLVKQSKALSDRTWQNIKNTIVEFMDQAKKDRIQTERRASLKPRLSLLESFLNAFRLQAGSDRILPDARELASFPEVRAIIQSPSEATVTVESFDVIKPRLPNLIARWKMDASSKLAELIKEAAGSSAVGAELTDLAIGMYYTCDLCNGRMSYPNVLVHQCAKQWCGAADSDCTAEEYELDIDAIMRATRWATNYLKPNVPAVKEVVTALGQDPMRVTPVAMDNLDVRLSCTIPACMTAGTRCIMTWRAAVEHVFASHSESYEYKNELSWKKINAEEVPQLYELEAASLTVIKERRQKMYGWRCGHCVELAIGARGNMVEHLRSSHNIDNPCDDDDVYYDPDRRGPSPRPVYLVSDKLSWEDLSWPVICALETGEAVFCEL